MHKLLNLVKILVIISILALPSTNLMAQTNGKNSFRLFFEKDAIGESAINSYLLMYVNYFTYENRIGAANFSEFKIKFKEIMQPLGFDNFNFINVTKATADTQVIIMSNEKLMIVAFRGSESSSNGKFSLAKATHDWLLTDFNIFKKTIFSWGWGVKIHYGFYKALDVVYTSLKNNIRSQLSGKLKRIWITGHSLGGGIAPIAAYKLNKDNFDIQGVYTYGAPRIGNKKFSRLFNESFPDIQRWVNNKDLVTKLPLKLMKYVHCGKPNNIYANGNIIKQDKEFKGIGKATSHKPIIYLQALYNALPEYIKSKVPTPPTTFRISINADENLVEQIKTDIKNITNK